jgi:hypothetical protein
LFLPFFDEAAGDWFQQAEHTWSRSQHRSELRRSALMLNKQSNQMEISLSSNYGCARCERFFFLDVVFGF